MAIPQTTQPMEPITIPDGEAIITEPDHPMLPISISSMSQDDGSPWAELPGPPRTDHLPLRIPSSDHGDPTRKVPTPQA